MISDQLLSVLLAHLVQGIECASKVTLELAACLYNLVHDLNALLVRDAGAEWEVSKIAADTDAGTLDHLGLVLGESWALQAVNGHLRLVFGIGSVTVVGLDDTIEKLVELLVRAVRASVHTDTGVDVLAA